MRAVAGMRAALSRACFSIFASMSSPSIELGHLECSLRKTVSIGKSFARSFVF